MVVGLTIDRHVDGQRPVDVQIIYLPKLKVLTTILAVILTRAAQNVPEDIDVTQHNLTSTLKIIASPGNANGHEA